MMKHMIHVDGKWVVSDLQEAVYYPNGSPQMTHLIPFSNCLYILEALEDAQEVPNNAQKVPGDAQEVPEDAQEVPGDAQEVP